MKNTTICREIISSLYFFTYCCFFSNYLEYNIFLCVFHATDFSNDSSRDNEEGSVWNASLSGPVSYEIYSKTLVSVTINVFPILTSILSSTRKLKAQKYDKRTKNYIDTFFTGRVC
jgi:hypothetical protein